MGQTKRISRIVIAEPNVFFRRGLETLFASDTALRIAGDASSGDQVVSKVRELKPDCLVLDVAFLRNPELALAIRQAQPGLLILVLANHDNEDNLAAAISCGARGLILKSASSQQLLAALRNVTFDEGGMNHSGLLPEFRALAKQTSAPTTTTLLTAREQEVMSLLAEGKTVRTVAGDLSLSMKTVEAHKLNLMRKLDIHNRASLVEYAVRHGMLKSAPAEA